MNPLEQLLALDATEKARLGVEATPAEIAQQPEMWRDTAQRFIAAAPAIREQIEQIGLPASPAEIVFAGAGTSDFVGRGVVGPVSAALGTRAIACPTTDIVTHPEYAFPSDRPALMVSIARSGNSPESVAAVEIALAERPNVRHLIITCNADGALAKMARQQGDRACVVALHPRTNDRGLAMTSSFTSMVVASLGLAYLGARDGYRSAIDRLATAGERVLAAAPDVCAALAKRKPGRACFLGSGALVGAAVESHLKLQEMTDGKLICFWDTFLGLRHGPRAAIHGDTLVVCFLSSDPQVRRYELDLIRSNREQKIGLAHLILADRASEEIAGLADSVVAYDSDGALGLPDHLLPPVATIVGQLLGLFASLEFGFKPDTPSAGGVISRVVEGVTIYPRERPGR